MRPASTEKLDEPAAPEMKSLSVLISDVNDSEPLKTKKLELTDFKPFCVNATAITDVAAPLFFTVKNLVTVSKLTCVVAPNATTDDVTKGVAEIWYAGT